MSLKLVTVEQMRKIDNTTIKERGVPGIELMERAGWAVSEEIVKHYDPKQVGIVTGKGNNAGDGLVVARLLSARGVGVRVIALTEGSSLSEAGRINLENLPEEVEILDRHSVPKMQEVFEDCDVLVDAILGTGVEGPPRGGFGEAIAVMNALDKPVVAIDIPSGLNTDSGEAEGSCIYANLTVAIGLPKIGMVLGVGPEVCGEIVTVDIGFPSDLLENPDITNHLVSPEDVGRSLPDRPYDGHKGTFGSLLVIAGSTGMSGAAYLTTAAALRSGCGMVYGAFPSRIVDILSTSLVEAIKVAVPGGGNDYLSHESWDTIEPFVGKATALAIGPGIGTNESTIRLVDELVCLDKPIVIDADALNCLEEKVLYLTKRTAPTVLTPHPGEMGRLMGISAEKVQASRHEVARKLAIDSQTVVLLKGAYTIIADPSGQVFVNPTGNSGMAKGGSGDLLTGLIGGLLAQGSSALDAARMGAYLHGLAGDFARFEFGERGMTAQDTLAQIPKSFLAFE